MFTELYDSISKLFSSRWPTVDAEVTAVRFLGQKEGLVVEYKFSLQEDGPYTGESCWAPWSGPVDVIDIHNTLPIGHPVRVRYRPDDPSVNTLDRDIWEGL